MFDLMTGLSGNSLFGTPPVPFADPSSWETSRQRVQRERDTKLNAWFWEGEFEGETQCP